MIPASTGTSEGSFCSVIFFMLSITFLTNYGHASLMDFTASLFMPVMPGELVPIPVFIAPYAALRTNINLMLKMQSTTANHENIIYTYHSQCVNPSNDAG